MLSESTLAHDEENQVDGKNVFPEMYEEASGIKIHLKKNGKYKEHVGHDKHWKSSG